MIAVGLVLCAIGVTIGVLVIAGIRADRAHQRYEEELAAERRETAIRYAGDDEITERRHSFSGWPFPNKK